MKEKALIILFSICILFAEALHAQDEMPDREQRIYTLSRIWKELEYNFAFPENLHRVNLDSLYLAYLPKVENAENNYDYCRLLSSFMAHFNEAHTRIYPSKRFDDIPPLQAINIGERIIVSNVAKSQVKDIPVNSEILKINDIPVLEYMKDSVYPYIAAATPQWKFDKSVLELFSGRLGSIVDITYKTPEGEVKEICMTRDYYANGSKEIMVNESKPPIEIKMLEDGIGYIKLNSFMGTYIDTVNQVFTNNLPQLQKCKGLIIDVRGNRGGSDAVWENIAFHLIPDSTFDMDVECFSRIHIACYKNWGINSTHPKLIEYNRGLAMTEVEHGMYKNTVDDADKLNQPLVVVSGQHVASAAEDFLLLMKNRKRAVVVGEPSVGCVGEPTIISLTGGLEAMICVKKYVGLDGLQPNDGGIMPDIYVKGDYESYLKGKDNILERAIRELKLM